MLILDARAMVRNPEGSNQAAPGDEARDAARETSAQHRLSELAAEAVRGRPWRPDPAPPAAVDLVQYAVWRSGELSTEDLLHSLTLVPAARAEVDGLEAGLLFTARSAGLTWAQIASAMGFRSPQACQQHFTRLAERQERDA